MMVKEHLLKHDKVMGNRWRFDPGLVKIDELAFFLGPNIMFYQYLGAKYYALHDKKYLPRQEYYESLLKSGKLG